MAKKTNIEINGKNYYRVTRTVGHKADGTAIKKQFYGTGIKEANEKADEYMNKIKNGYAVDFDKITINELIYNWLFNIKRYAVKPSTFQSYESNYRLFIKDSNLSSMYVKDCKKNIIQNLYNELFENGKSTEKIKMINKLLHSFFEYAIDEGYLLKNPCNKIVIPKNTEIVKKQEYPIFTLEEIEQIKKAFVGNKYETLILTAIYTGMREAELLGLKWENVNLTDGYIHVCETLKKVAIFDSKGNKEYKVITQDPKTQNSIRDVFIPKLLIELLNKIDKTSEYVFTNNGDVVLHKSLYSQWTKVLKKNNIRYLKFHALRHTYASTLLSKGVDLKTVSELMGHYDLKITQTYLHSLPEHKKNAVKIFDNL